MQLKGTLNNERACSVFADEASTALGQLLQSDGAVGTMLVGRARSPLGKGTEEDEPEFNSIKKLNRQEVEASQWQKRCRNLERALLENIKVNRTLNLENQTLQDIVYERDIRSGCGDMHNTSSDSLIRADSTSQLVSKRKPKFKRDDGANSADKRDRKYNSSGMFNEIKKNTK